MSAQTLGAYFEHVYLPSVSITPASTYCYRAAVSAITKLFGRKATRVDLMLPEQLELFRKLSIERGLSPKTVRNWYWRLRHIMRHARPDDFPKACGKWQRKRDGSAKPVDAPGTVWHFYLHFYKPERFDCSPASLQQVEGALHSLFRFCGGGLKFPGLCDKLLIDWCQQLVREGKKPETIRGYVGRIETIWRDAYQKGATDREPHGRRRRRQRSLPEAWTAAEFRQLIDATAHRDLAWKLSTGVKAGKFLRAVLLTAYDTGLRRGDIFRLRKQDLREDGALAIIQGKTGFAIVRGVSDVTLAAIREVETPGELLFPWPHDVTHFYRVYRTLLRLAGLPATSRNQLQKIRRTSASHAERVKPGAASVLLGHRDPSMAARHYVDPRIAARKPELPPALV